MWTPAGVPARRRERRGGERCGRRVRDITRPAGSGSLSRVAYRLWCRDATVSTACTAVVNKDCGNRLTRGDPDEAAQPGGRLTWSLEACRDDGDHLVELTLVGILQDALDLIDRVDHRRVVTAAEALADRRQRRLGEVATQVHGDLTRVGDLRGAFVAAQFADVHAELTRDLALYHLDRDRLRVAVREDVLQRLLGEVDVDRSAGDRGVADDPAQGALELADVGRHAAGDVFEDLAVGDREPLRLHLAAKDGDARLEVGTTDVDDDALSEARAQPVVELLELAWLPVGGDDDLSRRLVERVERVEELDLRLLLLGQELDVVDEQDVVVAVLLLEALDAALLRHCVDEVVGELLDRHVAHLEARVGGADLVGDGVHEVGLAETRVGVDEDRVVGGGRRFGHAARDGGGIFIVGADDPAVEGVSRIQALGAGGGGDRRGLVAGRVGRLGRGYGRDAAGDRRGTLVDDRAKADVGPHHRGQRVAQYAVEARVDPVLGEVVGDADDEDAVVEPERQRTLEPEAVRRVVEGAAKLGARLVPDQCQLLVDRRAPVRRCPLRGVGRARPTEGEKAVRRDARGVPCRLRSGRASRRAGSVPIPSGRVNEARDGLSPATCATPVRPG